jgi:hypothetical protein
MADSSVVKGQGELRTNHSLDDGNCFFQRHPAKASPMDEGAKALPERFVLRLLGSVAARPQMFSMKSSQRGNRADQKHIDFKVYCSISWIMSQ